MFAFIRLLLLLVALVAAVVAWADDEARPMPRLPESIDRVERETGGTVIQVNPIQRGDRQIYRMKVLTPQGRVKVMQRDPRGYRVPLPPREPPPGREPPEPGLSQEQN